jgi:hypothetical protein
METVLGFRDKGIGVLGFHEKGLGVLGFHDKGIGVLGFHDKIRTFLIRKYRSIYNTY